MRSITVSLKKDASPAVLDRVEAKIKDMCGNRLQNVSKDKNRLTVDARVSDMPDNEARRVPSWFSDLPVVQDVAVR